MALFDLNRAGDTPIATLKLSTIVPKNWHRFPPRTQPMTPAYLGDVSYSWPYNGIEGDDVNVATANATGAYEPKNQGNKANMVGNTLAVDITTPRGWVDPLEPYGPPATPTLASLNPPSLAAVHPDTSVALIGTNFMASSQIIMNGNPERTTFISPTELRTIVKATSFTAPGNVPVQVNNAGKLSAVVNLVITA